MNANRRWRIRPGRKPTTLLDSVRRVYGRLASTAARRHRARLWYGSSKQFIEEIVPLAVFARWRWPMDDVRIRHWRGNQGFDAEATSAHNCAYKTKIEITWPRDGKRQKEDAGLLNNGRARLGNVGAECKNTLKALCKTAKTKAQKNYRDGLLLFVTEPLMDFCRSELSDAIAELSKLQWQADEVYVLLNPSSSLIGTACPDVVRIK